MDITFNLIREPYTFLSKKILSSKGTVVKTRFMLKPTYCMLGRDAAEIFYDSTLFQRAGAVPGRLEKTLFGEGGVQALDGDEHRARKNLIMTAIRKASIDALCAEFRSLWCARLRSWSEKGQVNLFEELELLLFEASCRWVGLPVHPHHVAEKTKSISTLIDGSGGIGARYFRAKQARKSLETWLIDIIERVRQGQVKIESDSVVAQYLDFRDSKGRELSAKILAVELLNIVRPIVASARYMIFAAHAIEKNYEVCAQIELNSAFRQSFVQEVRRYYPFFPFLMAKVRQDFVWDEVKFTKGALALLDIYGTNHDARHWESPDDFQPARFLNWEVDPYSFIPQGGGEYDWGHRCAGEWMTVSLMSEAVRILVSELEYEVPLQDLSISLTRVPTLPNSGFIIKNVTLRKSFLETEKFYMSSLH